MRRSPVQAAQRLAASLAAVGVVLLIISVWTVAYLAVVGIVAIGLGVAWAFKAFRMARGHAESPFLLRRGFDPDESHERLTADRGWTSDPAD